QTKTARADEIDADEVAVSSAKRVMLGDVQLASSLFLVDGHKPSAALGRAAEQSEHAMLRVVDDLDDPPAIGRALVIAAFDAQQRAVADAGGHARPRVARTMYSDFWRLAAFDLIPFGGAGNQLAVGIASGNVGQHGRGQGCCL